MKKGLYGAAYFAVIALTIFALSNYDAAADLNADTITKDEWEAEIRHQKIVCSAAEPVDLTGDAEVITISGEAAGDYIDRIAGEYGLDEEIIRAVIKIESGGDPDAIGDGGEAIGLMQIQPRWHKARMERLGVTDLTDPEQNVLVGCDYLAELLTKYGGDYTAALTAYNAGNAEAQTDYAARVFAEMEEKHERVDQGKRAAS